MQTVPNVRPWSSRTRKKSGINFMLSAMGTQVRHSGHVSCDLPENTDSGKACRNTWILPCTISQLHPNLGTRHANDCKCMICLRRIKNCVVFCRLDAASKLPLKNLRSAKTATISFQESTDNQSAINNVGWPRHGLTNGDCFGPCGSNVLNKKYWLYRYIIYGWISLHQPTRHYHLSCDNHSCSPPLEGMSCTSHLATAGVQNVNKCDK